MKIKSLQLLLIIGLLLISNPKASFSISTDWPIKNGKYSCSASKYRNGSYEFIARGTIELKAGGNYVYNGFEKPSLGKFIIDKDGNINFKGGYLDKGKAEKMDRVNRFYVVFPSNPDNRWTASLQD